MKKLIVGLLAIVLVFSLVGTAMAASSYHSVAVKVEPINEITVNGILMLTINSTGEVTDDTTCTLDWSTNATAQKGAKISAQLDSDYTTGLTLKAAVAPGTNSNGTSAGTQTLSTTSVDLVTGLTHESVTGSVITYTATATMAVAPATYTQSVTYTIVAL